MRIVVEIDCRDPSLCGDCDYQLTRGRALCRLFRADLNQPNGDWSQVERCDECKAAEAYIERCDRMFTDNAEPDEAGL